MDSSTHTVLENLDQRDKITGGERKEEPDARIPKPNPDKFWLARKRRNKKNSRLLQLPNDLLWKIFAQVFYGVLLTDIKITQRNTEQRRCGAQSILFVCRDLRDIADAAMFRFATFEIPHFKLHEKHNRENKMTSLHKIQNLALLWTSPPSKKFTTTRAGDAYILNTIKRLRSLSVWLLAGQHFRLPNGAQWQHASRVELHEAMLAKFEPSISSQPRWLKRLLRDAPEIHKGVQISVVGFFAFGQMMDGDLTAAHISWPSKEIIFSENVSWNDWQRSRTGCVFRNFRGFVLLQLQYAYPLVGNRVFGRKVW